MLTVIGREDVSRLLDFQACIGAVGNAMRALSAGRTRQMLRHVTPIDGSDILSVMAGVMPPEIGFGSKVYSVFPDNAKGGRQAHQGVVVLFDAASGEPLCVAHAGEITRIRTAAASAVATDILARPDASRLAVLGCGEQGRSHVEAMSHVRDLQSVKLWSRSRQVALDAAKDLSARLHIPVEPADTVRDAVGDADIICTTTAATDPILMADWVADGTHLNLVGSSDRHAAEIDSSLVRRTRLFADHRDGVVQQGGEFLRARADALVDEDHILGEIGDVLNGRIEGRVSRSDVTAYKSIGHVVQDIASVRYLYDRVANDAAMTVAF